MEEETRTFRAHVVMLPFPMQGHINPMLQFAKRLASKGLKITIAITVSVPKSICTKVSGITIETILDGLEDNGTSSGGFLPQVKDVGSQILANLVKKYEKSCNPVSCIICDSICPWALEIAKELGIARASFFTQSCSVSSIYYHVYQGNLTVPIADPVVSIPGLPLLGLRDLPTFIYDHEAVPLALNLLLSQFISIDKADWLFYNTFDKLESEVLSWLRKLWPIKTIGPTTPSMYLDMCLEDDKDYGLSLFKVSHGDYMEWLNGKEVGSVIYVSFGSIAVLCEEQMEELAQGLIQSQKYFLWVVRETEQSKIAGNFAEEVSNKGLVVTWCSQLEVLAHEAIGCFVTHCGWNSTMEAMSLAVPLVTIPQASDQTTNAKLVQDVWEMGIRAGMDDKDIVRREEFEFCIREVMEGEKGKVMKKNASKLRELAKEAVDVSGSSDVNIEEFVATLVCTKGD